MKRLLYVLVGVLFGIMSYSMIFGDGSLRIVSVMFEDYMTNIYEDDENREEIIVQFDESTWV